VSAVSLGYSPCPNDTWIFHGLVHGRIPGAPVFREVLEDIDTLNAHGLQGRLDVLKASFHAVGHLLDRYCLLRSGGALGRGCGPLVVARTALRPEELQGRRLAIPGRLTTAALLLRLYQPGLQDLVVLPFDRILEAVCAGDVEAGAIIHESRFTYPRYGLHRVVDLGEWWEATTGHPIPLGGILARRSLGPELIERIDRALRESVAYAQTHAPEVLAYVRQYAQEMDEEVMQAHIRLYVNEFTLQYGPAGEAAIAELLRRAAAAGIVPPPDVPLFM
jgi:1,4-dihydroxy-6-naphthoate synthase